MKEHPVEVGVFVTVLAIGVVGVLAPECLAWLGFEEVGILEGRWSFLFGLFGFLFFCSWCAFCGYSCFVRLLVG